MKRLTSLVLIFFILLSAFPIKAFAAISEDNSTENVKEEILHPDEATMFEQMLEQLPLDEEMLMQEGVIDSSSFGVRSSEGEGTRAVTVTSYYYETLTMPSAMFYIVLTGWRDGDFTTTTYGGVECLKFTDSSYIVYVNTLAFFPDETGVYDIRGTAPSSNSLNLSNTITNYLNNGNTNLYYTGKWRIYSDVDNNQYVEMVLYGTQAYQYEEDEIVIQHKIVTSTGDLANVHLSGSLYPSITLEVTNTGSGQRYLGGFYIKGEGSNTTTVDLSSILQIGYAAQQIASGGAVANLVYANFATLFGSTISLSKSTRNSRYYYETASAPVSNTARGIYAYKVTLPFPYPLTQDGDWAQAYVGLLGADGTSLRYKVTITV